MFANKAIFFFGQEETSRDLCETKEKWDRLSESAQGEQDCSFPKIISHFCSQRLSLTSFVHQASAMESKISHNLLRWFG